MTPGVCVRKCMKYLLNEDRQIDRISTLFEYAVLARALLNRYIVIVPFVIEDNE
jgi:hypothetical protein